MPSPPHTGFLVSVATLGGGGGGSHDDFELRALIATNALAIAGKHPTITVQDSAGVSHTGATTFSWAGGTVSGSTLTLLVLAGPQGHAGVNVTVSCPWTRAGADSNVAGLEGLQVLIPQFPARRVLQVRILAFLVLSEDKPSCVGRGWLDGNL